MKIRNPSCAAILCAVAISVASSVDADRGVTLPSALLNGSPTAMMTYPDGSSLIVLSKKGRFPLVAGQGGQSVNIQIQFVPNPADNSLTVAALDGGTVAAPGNGGTGTESQSATTSVAVDGTATIQFQPDTQPGMYRVLLNQGGTMSLLQFWVPDPEQPDAGPPALQPSTEPVPQ